MPIIVQLAAEECMLGATLMPTAPGGHRGRHLLSSRSAQREDEQLDAHKARGALLAEEPEVRNLRRAAHDPTVMNGHSRSPGTLSRSSGGRRFAWSWAHRLLVYWWSGAGCSRWT